MSCTRFQGFKTHFAVVVAGGVAYGTSMCRFKFLPSGPRTQSRGLRIRAILLLVASVSACGKHGSQTSRLPPRDANVLLITLDTTRPDHLSCYQAGHAQTPNLDALAARGVRFTEATVQVPLTVPSHACIMTGEYPPANGLRDMSGFVLDKSHPTIASITQSAGFATAGFVGSLVLAKHTGLAHGFDFFDDAMGPQNEEAMPAGDLAERRASVVTDHALRWLKDNANRKFFLWAHYYDPHAPYNPPEPYRHQYAASLYDGEIAYMDSEVGRLLAGMAQLGLESRTLVIAIGDHGESLGEHGEATHGIFLYDATLHVPLIVAGPDVPHGKVISQQVRSIDLLPTITEFLGVAPSGEAQGVSLWPLIQRSTLVRSNYSYAESIYPRTSMGWSELRSMRTEEWKLILAPHPELYDVERDPGELHNLVGSRPAEADQLQKHIWEAAGTHRTETVTAAPVDPEVRQELASLGYVNGGSTHQIQLGTDAPDPKDKIAVLQSIERAGRLLDAHEDLMAAQLMEQVLHQDPGNPMAHLDLAMALERIGKPEQAVAAYQDAIQRGISTDTINARLGKLYLRLHQPEKAIESMNRANELNPADVENLRSLGLTELQLGHTEQAENAFKAILVQNDRYGPAYNGLGLVAIKRGDGETAYREFEKAAEVDPAYAEPFLNLGVFFETSGHKQQALQYYQEFLKKASPKEYRDLIPKVRSAVEELEARDN